MAKPKALNLGWVQDPQASKETVEKRLVRLYMRRKDGTSTTGTLKGMYNSISVVIFYSREVDT